MADTDNGIAAGTAEDRDRAFFVGLARAFAGALIFALPMLMTMEMWSIGFYIEPFRLALLLLLLIPLLTGLSFFSGFRKTTGLADEVVDSFVAVAVAVAMAVVILTIFGVVDATMSPREIIGKIALQVFPASIGAVLATDQLSGEEDLDREQKERRNSYPAELLMMGAGALFLGLNIAPTEEIVLLSYMMSPWQEIALVVLSLVLMHGFVYAVGFSGAPEVPRHVPFLSLFLRFTLVGYALVLVIALYLLWTFGRTDGTGLQEIISAVVVLGFPCAIGAAAARIVL